MYVVKMVVDGVSYNYGRWEDANKANEVALEVADQRGVETYVEYEGL